MSQIVVLSLYVVIPIYVLCLGLLLINNGSEMLFSGEVPWSSYCVPSDDSTSYESFTRLDTDFEGDGKADIINCHRFLRMKVALLIGAGFNTNEDAHPNYDIPHAVRHMNGDIHDDLIVSGVGGVVVDLSRKSSFEASATLCLAGFGTKQGYSANVFGWDTNSMMSVSTVVLFQTKQVYYLPSNSFSRSFDAHPKMVGDIKRDDGLMELFGFLNTGVEHAVPFDSATLIARLNHTAIYHDMIIDEMWTDPAIQSIHPVNSFTLLSTTDDIYTIMAFSLLVALFFIIFTNVSLYHEHPTLNSRLQSLCVCSFFLD